MKSLQTEILQFDQALSACLDTLIDPSVLPDKKTTDTLQVSFTRINRLSGGLRPAVQPVICTAILEDAGRKAAQALKDAAGKTDLLELRLDALEKITLPELLPVAAEPVIVTNRKKEEGGYFSAGEAERLAPLRQAIELGADYIDLEYASPAGLRDELIKHKQSTRIILSCHDIHGTPDLGTLLALWQTMTRIPADYYKLVTFARSPEDNLILFQLLQETASTEAKTICHAMGRAGLAGRVLAPFYGSALVYCMPPGGTATAPGQLDAGRMRAVWKILQAA